MGDAVKTLDPTAEGAVTFMHPFDAKEDPANVEQREISDEQLTRLKYALENAPSMMLARPVILDTEAMAVGGNHRLRAAKLMIGDDDYPKFNEWVREHHGIPFFIRAFESAAERREWRVRDNAEYAHWTDDGIAQLVTEHARDGGDMDLLGFDDANLKRLLDYDGGGAPDDDSTAPGLGAVEYKLIIECDDETHQAQLLEQLQGESLNVTAVAA